MYSHKCLSAYPPVSPWFTLSYLNRLWWILFKFGIHMYIRSEWFGIVNWQILSISDELSACNRSVFSFPMITSKYQSVSTKLGVCIDIMEVWFEIADGQILSVFDSVICLWHKSDGILSFPVFSSPELCSGWAIVITFCVSPVHPSINSLKRQLQSHWSDLFPN